VVLLWMLCMFLRDALCLYVVGDMCHVCVRAFVCINVSMCVFVLYLCVCCV